MNIQKLGAIDIGSNGVRLLISNVLEEQGEAPKFTKASLVRVPIRLGADVFLDGLISEENLNRLSETMQAFSLLMKVNQVRAYRACATSAMREATNGQAVADEVFKRTGVRIEIIDGAEEARIIASTDISSFIQKDKDYLYIDVGGGSTEFTIFSKGKEKKARSFPIGTVRLLDNKVTEDTWHEVQHWIEKHTKDCEHIEAIGSGGNINKIHKNSNSKDGDPLTYEYLTDYYNYVSGYSYDERIRLLGFNPDRADVILYALTVFINAMKWSGAQKVHVPRIGLADGIIKTIYNEENK
ncbi:Ppx/GppA phosphatase family protein [Capnocytophaga sp. oral taxon 878]|uniref:Ppx/GppA phosphatase family protein n=1 Tax=Capnocytophaga sp. oral taxon 878 TaxID=1316596 RepID=UPI000D025C5A|nr:exopolyphosphatase [Capnocytophaga sp. oral taxon 878]AVM49614.1 exopolyphosphatase [Capnocytophaga sp. oral taxon 878]